mmetsp:Transcript_39301/g.111104  ORF Transcript_39301/g.111104 Transcript_39301/m.111104 type:complete len:295 (-) Transcript_39301:76-960(-)
MRRCSSGRMGLWSSDRGTARRRSAPPSPRGAAAARQRTARESPTFATSTRQAPGAPGVGKRRARIRVEPSRTSSWRALCRNSPSAAAQASVTACARCSSVNDGLALRHFCRCAVRRSTRWSTQRLPEWPSRTQKPWTGSPSGDSRAMSSRCLSSCTSLLPCQDEALAATESLPTRTSCTAGRFALRPGRSPRRSVDFDFWPRLSSSISCVWPYSKSSCRSCISVRIRRLWSSPGSRACSSALIARWRRTCIAVRSSSLRCCRPSSCLSAFSRWRSERRSWRLSMSALGNFLRHR